MVWEKPALPEKPAYKIADVLTNPPASEKKVIKAVSFQQFV